MNVPPLIIGNKTAKIPIVQGGMGVGVSLYRLAGAVAKEGGVGIISAAQIGFREPDFDINTKEANLRAIGKEMKLAREIAPQGIIGFNIMVAMKYYEEYVREAAKCGADIIISGAGLPTDLPAYVAGTDTKIAPIVSTEKSAHVILKYWDKKYHRMADMLVIEGPKAGGHLGFTKEQLEQFDEASYKEEIQKIMAVVRMYADKYQRHIPVVLAGGISEAKEVQNAFALGADGVQVASRFVTTEECDADIRYKEAYLSAGKEDIVIVKSPVGMPGRAIANSFMEKVAKEGRIAPKTCRQCLAKCKPAEIPYCITEALINAANGDIDNALLFCGAEAYKAERIETVKEVIEALFFKENCV